MILVAIGSNLPGPWGRPAETAARAVNALTSCRTAVTRTSRFYRTAAVGPGPQCPFVNLIVAVETHMPPLALLMFLHRLERQAGRSRGARWRARTLDLDLIAYHRVVRGWPRGHDPSAACAMAPRSGSVVVPHPRLHLRPFVVRPLLDIAPMWHHPRTGASAAELWLRLKHQGKGRILARMEAVR